jgi:hypothetical protein
MSRSLVESRASLRSVDDAKWSMRSARRRFAKDRIAGVAATADGFRAWAKKTYNRVAVRGKLLALVGGQEGSRR